MNSMYQWYERADVCYVYLVDLFRHYLDDTSRPEDFGRSRWFSRGWTLQELLAPPAVVLCDCEWREPKSAGVAAKTSWAFQRDTARAEDIAYCLMGIFDVNMPLLYREGDRAFLRLQHEILRASKDKSLFAWGGGAAIDEFLGMSEDESLFAYGNATLASRHTGTLAPSPGAFREAGDLIPVKQPTLANAQSLYHDLVHPDASTKPPTLSHMAALAARNAHPSILSFCFSEGLTLNPELVNDPLIYATCDSGSVAVFRVLVDHGMDVDRYLELGGSPLVSACQAGNVELARFLLDRGADPNNGYALGDYEALVRAIVGSNASLDLVELLLARGTVVKGTGALIAAAEHGNLGAVRLLLKHGKRTGDLDLEETEEYGAYDQRKLDGVV
ncbi:hypothetical protein HO173_011313 [Letharia columbiana]|uniref:DUF8212 domain-containing protein n=1 Tax=Letharia columbiana TaxID=112416 RepID=A0A8H6KZA3_9LECA|nr:uncharacterized protein HO173_011313 [Letharia columbiana]KAF6229667.1 hypothetical protein HO173_011313 [Letharia columbiana]